MRTLKTSQNKLTMKDNIETIFEKKVTKFGNGAKIDCPKQYLDKNVYVIVRREE